MKKKFLSLMMAAAVVATTSVSAFASEAEDANVIPTTPSAATGEERLDISDGDGETTNIGITGNVANKKNEVLPTTISVTVPTAAKFTVTKDGVLVGSNITIRNEGTETVSIIAEKFIDKSGTDDINVVSESELGTDRKNVSLKLTGELAMVNLKTETTNKLGLVKKDGTVVQEGEGLVLDNIKGGKSKTLSLTGKAVTTGDPLETAINDSFTLMLRVKKEK